MKNKSASILNLNKELTENIQIDVKSFDKLFSKIPKIDFIKIDCDGSDADIILSGRSLIKKHRPIILFEDLGGYHVGMGSKDLISKLDLDYEKAFTFKKI